MSEKRKAVYRSSNGDVWYLAREDSGRVYVGHEPNAASGGTSSRLDIATFLATGPEGPQHQALLSMIGSLVDGDQVAASTIPKGLVSDDPGGPAHATGHNPRNYFAEAGPPPPNENSLYMPLISQLLQSPRKVISESRIRR